MKLEEMVEIQQNRENLIGANADFRIERYRYNENTQELYIYFLTMVAIFLLANVAKKCIKASMQTNMFKVISLCTFSSVQRG